MEKSVFLFSTRQKVGGEGRGRREGGERTVHFVVHNYARFGDH